MVLNSPGAVAMSVFVVRAFMQLREQLAANAAILKRLTEINKTLLEHDSALRAVWTKLQPLLAPPPEPPRRRTGSKLILTKPPPAFGGAPGAFEAGIQQERRRVDPLSRRNRTGHTRASFRA
jgi:hypothetical protein